MEPEDLVREPGSKDVRIGQVHLTEVTHHRAILTRGPDSVKNGYRGA
jgi:hypothetical protein